MKPVRKLTSKLIVRTKSIKYIKILENQKEQVKDMKKQAEIKLKRILTHYKLLFRQLLVAGDNICLETYIMPQEAIKYTIAFVNIKAFILNWIKPTIQHVNRACQRCFLTEVLSNLYLQGQYLARVILISSKYPCVFTLTTKTTNSNVKQLNLLHEAPKTQKQHWL